MLPPFSFNHEVAIGAIMKNEEPYIVEWLDYHIAAGITKFYIYDNNDEPERLRRVIKSYIDAGIVEYIFFPGQAMQNHAYNDVIARHRFDARYIALIDGDEFIYPLGGGSIPDMVNEIMTENPGASGLTINWRMYGSSGQQKKDMGRGVLERFTWRANDGFEINQHIKSIVNPRHVEIIVSPHYAIYFTGKYAVDEHGRQTKPHYRNLHNTADRIRINHYITKSAEEYVEKKRRGPGDKLGANPDDYDFGKYDRNDIHDDGIIGYLDKMRSMPRTGAEGKKTERLSSALKLVTALATDPEKAVSGSGMEDYLCHVFACRKSCREYLADDAADMIEKTLLKKFPSMLTTARKISEMQLLFSVLPELLTLADRETGKRILAVSEKAIPQLLALYSHSFDGFHSCQMETVSRYLEGMKHMMAQ